MIKKGMNSHKKIEYSNFLDKNLFLGLETDLPSILKIKSQNIEIGPRGTYHIKICFYSLKRERVY